MCDRRRLHLIDKMEKAVNVETQFAKIDDNNTAYRKFGAGPPVILTNRFRGTLDTWDPLFLDLLSENYTVIIFDYPGIGYSDGALPLNMTDVVRQVIKLADFLHIDTFHLIGWSYGGWVAQYVVFQNTSRVVKAVIIGSNPMGENEIPFETVFMERALKSVNDADDYTVLFFEPSSETSRSAAQASTERIMTRLNESNIPSTQEVFQRYFASSKPISEDRENFRGAYQTLETPILVISGDHDISFAVENWFPLLRKAPTIQIIVLPASGHAPHFQYPELTTGYIHNFLRDQ
jgi:pimeloyl-ACP methyl ester carboxylesterase